MEELGSPPSANGKVKNPLHGKRITELKAALLLPSGITIYEPAIREAVARSIPLKSPDRDSKMERVQDVVMLQLRNTQLQCWMLGTPCNDRVQMCGFIFTQVVVDPFSGDKNLNLSALSMFYPFETEAISGILSAIEPYARDSGCVGMITTVDLSNRRAIMGAQELGFEAVTFSGYRRL